MIFYKSLFFSLFTTWIIDFSTNAQYIQSDDLFPNLCEWCYDLSLPSRPPSFLPSSSPASPLSLLCLTSSATSSASHPLLPPLPHILCTIACSLSSATAPILLLRPCTWICSSIVCNRSNSTPSTVHMNLLFYRLQFSNSTSFDRARFFHLLLYTSVGPKFEISNKTKNSTLQKSYRHILDTTRILATRCEQWDRLEGCASTSFFYIRLWDQNSKFPIKPKKLDAQKSYRHILDTTRILATRPKQWDRLEGCAST